MRRFGRDMRGKHVIEPGRVELCERRYGGSTDEAVEEHGNAVVARGKRRAQDRGKFASAKRRRDLQRITERGTMRAQPGIDGRRLARETGIVDACAAAHPSSPGSSKRAAAIAEADVVLPMPISPKQTRSVPFSTAS